MSEVVEPEEPSYEITGAIAGPKEHKKGKAAGVLGAVIVAGVVAVLSARKKGKSGPTA
jgi:hypothetical protein